MKYLWSFLAGFLSTLIFHQGLVGLFFALSIFPKAAYDLTPTQPLGVPSVLSLAFFGGLWGVLIWKYVSHLPNPQKLIRSLIFGAIGPTFVALAVVFPLKGLEFNPLFIPFGLLLNAAWGFGLWLIMKLPRA